MCDVVWKYVLIGQAFVGGLAASSPDDVVPLRKITAEGTTLWLTVKSDSASFIDTIHDKLTQKIGCQLADRIGNGTGQKVSFGS
jgi:hypothetical protein